LGHLNPLEIALIVDPWCGQIRDSVMKLLDDTLTIATGVPLTVVTATPPTFDKAAKSETFTVVLSDVGDVTLSPAPAHAASAAAAAAYAPSETNLLLSIGAASNPELSDPHAHPAPHPSFMLMFFSDTSLLQYHS
jgi:hypothetical protein